VLAQLRKLEEERMTEAELAELQKAADAGDRNAIRELRMMKLTDAATARLVGAQKPDANGRIAGDPLYVSDKEETTND